MKEFEIKSEDPAIHWPADIINVDGKNVLDLGCGRWESKSFNDSTPGYFLEQGARNVYGVDSSEDEIKYFRSIHCNNAKFACLKVETKDQLIAMINHFNIDVIKSDIEGKELLFLQFTKEDVKNIQSFYIEYHGHPVRNYIKDKLLELGYNITHDGKLWIDGFGVLFANKLC